MRENILDVRRRKMQQLIDSGVEVFPSTAMRSMTNSSALENFNILVKDQEKITLVGRVRSHRLMGKILFAHIEDQSGSIQIVLKKDTLSLESFKLFAKNIEVGDFIQVTGLLFLTKKEEKTLEVESWKILTKALRPLPDNWYGFKDEEEKLRKRYLDILFNKDVREMFVKKAKFWQAIRSFHMQHGFLEVETPILEVTTGGGDADPFVTYHNALNQSVYLRISAGELWQKRLMVAGYEKTFEIGRIFRNEGMSPEHLQDYTQIEAYWAYANFEDMYKFLKECYQYVIKETFGTSQFSIRGFNVDFSGEWPLIDYTEIILEKTGINIWNSSDTDIINKLEELHLKYEAGNRGRLIDTLWKYCRKSIAGPAILIYEPKITSPLAKASFTNPKVTERFHFIIAGSEVGQGYSELNDPIDQRERFSLQQALRDGGDHEAHMADFDFVEALEYGMPPAAGHGFGDRLFSFLMDKPIRECQIFPLMKPKEDLSHDPSLKKQSKKDLL